MTLDFTGTWPQDFDTSAEVTMGLGSLTLRFPTDLGVAVHMRQGDRYVSRNYDQARVKLDLKMHAVLGDVNVEWIGQR